MFFAPIAGRIDGIADLLPAALPLTFFAVRLEVAVSGIEIVLSAVYLTFRGAVPAGSDDELIELIIEALKIADLFLFRFRRGADAIHGRLHIAGRAVHALKGSFQGIQLSVQTAE